MREKYKALMWPILIPTVLFVAALVIMNNINKSKREIKKRYKLPPGRRGLPLVGDSFNWLSAVASSHPPQFVHQQVSRFGKIFSCSIFGKWAVVSADPTFNKFVMQNEGKLFQSSYPKSFRDLVGKNGVITVQGERQRKLHSIASNMMRLDKLIKLNFLENVQSVMLQTLNSLDDGTNQVILLQDVCRKLAINLMVNQLLGVTSQREVSEMAKLFSDFVDGCLSLPINLPGFAYHTAMKAREEIIRKISKTIEKHRQKGNGGRPCPSEGEGIGDGVLGRLIEEECLPDDAVADFIINLLFAGNETTAKTMLFALYFLSQSPKAMLQILEEQESLISPSGESLTWQDYKTKMPFTQCVIDETLRLGGIAIWLLREAKEDVTYQDYVIPKGTVVVPFLSAVHLDENLYEGALSFNPWRWMDPPNQEKRNWRNSNMFCPFGGGARFCPGAELARLQIAFFLHYFVTTYRWIQVKEDRMSFFPSARLVNGFQVSLVRRHPQMR